MFDIPPDIRRQAHLFPLLGVPLLAFLRKIILIFLKAISPLFAFILTRCIQERLGGLFGPETSPIVSSINFVDLR